MTGRVHAWPPAFEPKFAPESPDEEAEIAAARVRSAITRLNTPTRQNMAVLLGLRHDEITAGLLRLGAREEIIWLGPKLGYGLKP